MSLFCDACEREGHGSQKLGDRCRCRTAEGRKCSGRLVEPTLMACATCGRLHDLVKAPRRPDVVLRCKRCGGRLATFVELLS